MATDTNDLMKAKLAAYYSDTNTLGDLIARWRKDTAFDFGTTPISLFNTSRTRDWYTAAMTALSITYAITDSVADLAHSFWTSANLTTLAALV